jgi:hypothetical protein
MQRLQETLDDGQCHREHLASLYGLAKLRRASLVPEIFLEEKLSIQIDLLPVRISNQRRLVESVEAFDLSVG